MINSNNNIRFFQLLLLVLISSCCFGQTMIEYGDNITQSTVIGTDQLQYTLCAEAGDQVFFRSFSNNVFVSPQIEILLNGETLAFISHVNLAELLFTFNETDCYLILVSDDGSNDVGEYVLSLQRTFFPIGGIELNCNSSHSNNLELSTSIIAFTTQVEANTDLRFIVTSDNVFVSPRLDIYNENNDLLASESAVNEINYTQNFSSSECITIFVMDDGGNDPGLMNISTTILGNGGCEDCGAIFEICGDNIDNDNNNLTDCEDPVCTPIITNVESTNPTAPDFNNGTITINAIGQNLMYSINNGASFFTNNIFTELAPGTYNIIVQSNGGCSTTDDNNPLIMGAENIPCETPIFTWLDNLESVCPNAPFQLSAIANNANFDFELFQNDTSTGLSIIGTGNDTNFSPISISEASTFSIIATLRTDPTCVFEIEDTWTVDIGSLDLTYETVQETAFNNNGAIDLCINGGTAPYDIFYEPDRGSLEEVTGFCDYDLSIDALKAGYYVVEITDANGCTGIEIIKVDNPDKRRIGFPEKPVLTPNGDGKNDELVFDGLFLFPESNELIIYDRFGGVLFQQENYLNTWDATYQGTPVPADTYFYALRVFMGNEEELYRGYITIIR